MEGLPSRGSPSDGRPSSLSEHRDCPIRLPTPDFSQSRPSGEQRRDAERDDMSSGTVNCSSHTRDQASSVVASASENAKPFEPPWAPRSPPYRDFDVLRPSLPPLKAVLGDTMASPPQTPNLYRAGFQPPPREPAYSTTTYKPPPLYPNKKHRTDLLDPAPDDSSRRQSTFPRSGLPETQHRLASSDCVDSLPAFELPLYSGRRLSVQPSSMASHQHRTSPVLSGAVGEGGQRYCAPTKTSASSTFSGSFPGPHSTSSRSLIPHGPEGGYDTASRAERPFATATYHGPSNAVRDPSRLSPPCPQMFRPLHEEERSDKANAGMPFGASAYQPSPYDAQPFFMPSQYEYQHGKARKRSNLPKQSTEIMKTWFDHNISNPYPSEDQKAIFSRVRRRSPENFVATGISMTQVSNWFINHRRRCPELRDRREKHRVGGSRDGDAL